MAEVIRRGRMAELLPGLSVVGAMILLGGLIALSGCTSTGHWSAGMVVPKMKEALDTRRVVPLDSPPRRVNGWECDNDPLFLQPGGNAFVSTGILRSLKKNFSSRATGLLKASGEWTVTDYGLWNTTCVRYTGIAATILPSLPPRIAKIAPSGRVLSSPLGHKQPSSPPPAAPAPVLASSPPPGPVVSQSPVPRVEPWMVATSGARLYHSGFVSRSPDKSASPPTPPAAASQRTESQTAALKSTLSAPVPPQTPRSVASRKGAAILRIEPWMDASSGARVYHGGFASWSPDKGVSPPPAPGAVSQRTGSRTAALKSTLLAPAPPQTPRSVASRKGAAVLRTEAWMTPPAPGEIFHGDLSSPQ